MSTSGDMFQRAQAKIEALRAEARALRAAAQAKVDAIDSWLRRINDLEATGNKWRLAEKAAEVKAIKDGLGVLGVDATDWDGTIGGPTPAP